jgi:hypothetical protein
MADLAALSVLEDSPAAPAWGTGASCKAAGKAAGTARGASAASAAEIPDSDSSAEETPKTRLVDITNAARTGGSSGGSKVATRSQPRRAARVVQSMREAQLSDSD